MDTQIAMIDLYVVDVSCHIIVDVWPPLHGLDPTDELVHRLPREATTARRKGDAERMIVPTSGRKTSRINLPPSRLIYLTGTHASARTVVNRRQSAAVAGS